MAKRKSQSKNCDWVSKLCIALVALAVIGGVVFGIIKLVDHFKPAEKPNTEQTEQVPDKNTGTQTPEEKIATASVEAYLAK